MIMAMVVAHGQRPLNGVDSGRTREAANAVPSTTAYSAANKPVVTFSILPGLDLQAGFETRYLKRQVPGQSPRTAAGPQRQAMESLGRLGPEAT